MNRLMHYCYVPIFVDIFSFPPISDPLQKILNNLPDDPGNVFEDMVTAQCWLACSLLLMMVSECSSNLPVLYIMVNHTPDKLGL